MVMADRNTDEFRNGRRSRGPSPQSDDSTGDDSEQDAGMRVGDEYQAQIPEYTPDVKIDGRPEAMLVWAPHEDLSEIKIDEYIVVAKEKHGYNTEQALGMLFWHKHNIEKALSDLPNFTPFPDEWTVEDKVLFEQAFGFHGKSFHRIRQMLPDKTIASLVKYYYTWKKTRSRTSLMDRQAKRLANQRDESNGLHGPTRFGVRKLGAEICDEISDEGGGSSEGEGENTKENGKEEKTNCCNCGSRSTPLHHTPKGTLCSSCYQHWRRTGIMRAAGQKRHESQHTGRPTPPKHKRKPPRGMYLKQEDLLAMASGPPGQAEAILKALDSDLVSLKRQVQNNKQMISMQKHKLGSGISQYFPNSGPMRLANKWTNEELLLAVQGVRKYGKDYKAIADVIGNKSESHVRAFFQNFRRRYNLDEVLAEYFAEHGAESVREEDEEDSEHMEVDKPQEGVTAATVPNIPAPATSEPPPLLKQPAAPSTKAPHTRLLPPQKTILQQPPPLIRPGSLPPIPTTNLSQPSLSASQVLD